MRLQVILNRLFSWIRRNKAEFLVLLFFIVLACVWWYPLPLHLLSGQLEYPPIDPLFNQWILAWGSHALTHYPWRFFDANMFYPFHHSLAWGDQLFSLTIFALPLIPIFGLVGAYNILLIGSSAFSAFTAYLLAHYLTKNRAASIVAGLMFGFTYYRFIEYGHIQILATQWIPLVFLFAEKIRREYSKSNLMWFILVTFLMLATNLYLAIFTILSFLIYALVLIGTNHLSWLPVKRFILGWIVAGVPAGIIYLPSIVLQLRHPLVRGYDNQISLNLHGLLPWPWPGHILRKALEVWGHPVLQDPTYHTLGLVTYLIIIVGLIVLASRTLDKQNRVFSMAFMLIAFVGICAAAGPIMRWNETVLLHANPFFTIPYHFVPGYKALRVPMRWFLLSILGLGTFSALVLTHLWQKWPKKVVFTLVALFTVWIIIEQAPAPVKVTNNYRLADYPAYQWLAMQPGEVAILEVPIFPGIGNHGNDIIEARRMYLSTITWKRKVSGAIMPYIPQAYVDNAGTLNALGDDPAALALLKQWNVAYIVFLPDDYKDLGWPDSLRDHVKQQLDASSDVTKVVEYPNGTLYRVKGTE